MATTAKVTLLSCHAMHVHGSGETSKLFKKLVKAVERRMPMYHAKEHYQVAVEMLNRSVLVNLTPPGILQYDDPNVFKIEQLTQCRIFWTFAYDTPFQATSPKTRAQQSLFSTRQLRVHDIQAHIHNAVLNTFDNMKDTPLQIFYTSAAPPNPKHAEVYSLIEYDNPNISMENIHPLSDLYGMDIHQLVSKLINENMHTRYYIGVHPNTPDPIAMQTMKQWFSMISSHLDNIEKSIAPLRQYSNELTYFNPNPNEVLRSLIPMLQNLSVNDIMNSSNLVDVHPFLLHSQLTSGYQLMCGPDYVLEKLQDDIEYSRTVNGRNLRFGSQTTSLYQQMVRHFNTWMHNLRFDAETNKLMKPLPKIPLFIQVMHACNACRTEDNDGVCECFMHQEPFIDRGSMRFKPLETSNWIKYSPKSDGSMEVGS